MEGAACYGYYRGYAALRRSAEADSTRLGKRAGRIAQGDAVRTEFTGEAAPWGMERLRATRLDDDDRAVNTLTVAGARLSTGTAQFVSEVLANNRTVWRTEE